jgi:hypothetical protein
MHVGESTSGANLLEAAVARSTRIQVYVQMYHDASANVADGGLSLRVTKRSFQHAESVRCWFRAAATQAVSSTPGLSGLHKRAC